MFNRMSALWLVLGLVGGYALGGPGVKAEIAQADPTPTFVAQGDEVSLHFEAGALTEGVTTFRCTVAAVVGTWIRCADDRFAAERVRKWYSLQRLVAITEREK